MDLNLQIIISLMFVIIPQFLLCFYLIHKYGKVLTNDMGAKVGENFNIELLNNSDIIKSISIENLRKSKILLCFVSTDCPSCNEVIKYMNENLVDEFNKIYFVIEGQKNKVEDWYLNNKYTFHATYIEEDILLEELKINRFPFAFCLNESVVINKGPLFKEIIPNYISSVT